MAQKAIDRGHSPLVVCEKFQKWSMTQMQKAFLNIRRQIKASIEDVTKEFEILNTSFYEMKYYFTDYPFS